MHLRDKVAGSTLKNNQKSQTPALALWPMWPAGPEAWEVASPRALLQASRPSCRAPGTGRGWSHLAVSKEMPSPAAADVFSSWAVDSLGIAPASPTVHPSTTDTQARGCMRRALA